MNIARRFFLKLLPLLAWRGSGREGDFETERDARSGYQNWRSNAKTPLSEDDGLSCNPTVREFRYRSEVIRSPSATQVELSELFMVYHGAK